MRVGDSRWPLRYLSSPLCSILDISFSWMYSQPVHSSMSCIHCLLGLPWCRNPSMIPSETVSANCPALPRVMWPNIVVSALPLFPWPNSVNIESFVRCSCHEMLSIFSPTPHFKSFYFVSVRFLQSPSLHSILEYCPHHWLNVLLIVKVRHIFRPMMDN